jgi:hypothetical protein
LNQFLTTLDEYEHRDLPEEFRIDRKKLNYQVRGKNKEHEGKNL